MPTSINIISIIVMVLSALAMGAMLIGGGLNMAAYEAAGMPDVKGQIAIAVSIAGPIIGFICALNWRSGKDWARKLFVAWFVLSMVLGFVLHGNFMLLLPGLVINGIVLFFLYRPAVKPFFAG